MKFSVNVTEQLGVLPTIYWLPKLRKRPYKARFIDNSSSCTTTELTKLLTSCFTAVKTHVIRYSEKVYERSGNELFWLFKKAREVLNKLKSREFNASSLSTYDFSYITLPNNLTKEKLTNLNGSIFQREALFIFFFMIGMQSFLLMAKYLSYQNVCDALSYIFIR